MKEKVRIAEETLNKNNEQMKLIQKNNDAINQELINKKKDMV